MNNTTNEGSKLYLYSITSVAILGGLLFGYDTAVISGAEKGLEAFFLSASDFQYNIPMRKTKWQQAIRRNYGYYTENQLARIGTLTS